MWPQKEMMDMRGRPKIDDVRDKLYRVRVNDEEEQMLGYICSAIGIKKSDVFRRALALYYQNVRLNEYTPGGHEEEGWTTDHISLKRIVDCPHCGSPNRIDLSDDCSESSYERQMGEEILYEFDIEGCECSSCGKLFRVSGHISEYPVGAFDSEEIKISPQ